MPLCINESYATVSCRKIVRCAIFIICPILSLPLLFAECYNNKRYAYWLFALFMGVCSLLLVPPYDDLFRNFKIYTDRIEGVSWPDFILYLSYNVKFDFFVYLLEWIYQSLGMSFGWVRLTLVFVSYLLFFYLYDSFCKEQYTSIKDRRRCFWMILLIMPFLSISTGLRYGMAACLFSYVFCMWFIFKKYYWWHYLLLIMGVFTHFSMLMLVLVLLISSFMPNNMPKAFWWIVFFALVTCSSKCAPLLEYLAISDSWSDYLLKYTEGRYSDGSYLEGHNIFFWIPYVARYLVVLMFFCAICRNVPYNKETKIMYVIFFLFAITVQYHALNKRIDYFFTLLGGLYILKYVGVRKLFFNVLMLYTIFTILISWRGYTITRWYYLFAPIPIAISMDYDQKWVNENINYRGERVVYDR